MEKTEKKDTVRRVYRKYDKKNKGFILFEDLLYLKGQKYPLFCTC